MASSVLAGCGLCPLPTWLINKELEEGRLVTVLNSFAGAKMPIHAIWPKTLYPKPKVRAIIDELQKVSINTPEIFGSDKL